MHIHRKLEGIWGKIQKEMVIIHMNVCERERESERKKKKREREIFILIFFFSLKPGLYGAPT